MSLPSVALPLVLSLLLPPQDPGGEAPRGDDAPAFPAATPESQGMSSRSLEGLAETVQGFVDADVVVGAELLVVKNRRTVLHRTFGWRDREEELPMVADTIFNIRSMTKPLTGAALQILVDAGEVRPEAPVAEYLPGFRNERSGEITVEQLLTHHSGLPGTILESMTDYPDLISMGNAAGEHGPQFEPGARFWYSDSGTDVVGAIVEQVSGMRLDEFVRTRLLEPLGMEDALYAPEDGDSRWSRVASLYLGDVNRWVRFWTPRGKPFYAYPWGSQSVYCTPVDYARFLAMWMDGGVVNEEHILSPDAIRRSLGPVSVMSLPLSDTPVPTGFPGLEIWYGQMAMLHVRPAEGVGESPQVVILGHGGSDGTRAWAWPEEDLMVLYFTQSRDQATAVRLEQQMHRLLFGGGTGEQVAPVEWKPYLGTYVANYDRYRDVEFTILYEDGHLALDVPGKFVFELKDADEEGRWVFADYAYLAVSFDRGEDGEVTNMKLYKPGVVHDLPRGKAPDRSRASTELEREEVEKYLGVYRDEREGVDVELVFRDGALVALVPEVPIPLELEPPDEDDFWVVMVDPSLKIRFVSDEDGEVVAFEFHVRGEVITHHRLRDDGGSGAPDATEDQDRPEPELPELEALPRDLGERLATFRDRVPEEAKAYELLAALTSEVGPRFAGSANDRRAVEWALRKLEELGFENVRAEEVVVPCWRRGEAEGEIIGASPQPLHPLALGGSVGTPPDGVDAEVIEVDGLEALARLARDDVEGRIVFFNQRMPRGKEGRGYGEVSPIRRHGPARAAARGAVAALIRSVSTSTGDQAHTGMTHYEEGVPRIPAASLSNPEADLLETRIREDATARIRLLLGCEYLADTKSANVIGEIPGREHPEEVVLLAAHLDSWDVGTGALDDGAGCAIVIEAARLIGELEPAPRRTIRVLLAANEEFGLSGALAYAERHAGEIDEHVLGLESDFGADPVWLMRSRVAEEALPAIRDLARLLAPLGVEYADNDSLGGADLLPMVRHRLPLLEMRHDATRYFDAYHSAEDTLDKVDPRSLERNVAVYAVAALLAAELEGGFGPAPRFRGRLPAPFDRLYEGKPLYR